MLHVILQRAFLLPEAANHLRARHAQHVLEFLALVVGHTNLLPNHHHPRKHLESHLLVLEVVLGFSFDVVGGVPAFLIKLEALHHQLGFVQASVQLQPAHLLQELLLLIQVYVQLAPQLLSLSVERLQLGHLAADEQAADVALSEPHSLLPSNPRKLLHLLHHFHLLGLVLLGVLLVASVLGLLLLKLLRGLHARLPLLRLQVVQHLRRARHRRLLRVLVVHQIVHLLARHRDGLLELDLTLQLLQHLWVHAVVVLQEAVLVLNLHFVGGPGATQLPNQLEPVLLLVAVLRLQILALRLDLRDGVRAQPGVLCQKRIHVLVRSS
mmetsp:Transcript_6633/g.12582  ORF Transcript_6633/g.12582 Transcript_6633/m.12582 type:complete len:324 (-) Transcript_6633:660-1631(-)